MHVHDNQAKTGGFVMGADDGQALWFLNTLTINNVRGEDSQGRLRSSITGSPRASRRHSISTRPVDEAFLVLAPESVAREPAGDTS
jgi:hypothetical protein